MSLLIDGPAGAVSFEAKGTYGQTLAQIFKYGWQRNLRLLIMVERRFLEHWQLH